MAANDVGRDGVALEGDEVRLWHPIGAEGDEVADWRRLLVDAEVAQPFKQAFRETYALTPAEAATARYSNRIAGHVLRDPQAAALMRARGWRANALGGWDGGSDAEVRKELEGTGHRASFAIELVRTETLVQTADLCATDQVRLERRDADGVWPLAELAEVPAVVFSEVMRDVDLFVGVTSIATDPTWEDRGEDRFRDDWTATTFGELSETADVRRNALRRLVPKLRIAERCQVEERFLVVRGDLATYRVHLGSGNVLMEPASRYLCIVADKRKRKGPRIFLPFEDDGMLATILLKAFPLAADTAIDDPAIRLQRTGDRFPEAHEALTHCRWTPLIGAELHRRAAVPPAGGAAALASSLWTALPDPAAQERRPHPGDEDGCDERRQATVPGGPASRPAVGTGLGGRRRWRHERAGRRPSGALR